MDCLLRENQRRLRERRGFSTIEPHSGPDRSMMRVRGRRRSGEDGMECGEGLGGRGRGGDCVEAPPSRADMWAEYLETLDSAFVDGRDEESSMRDDRDGNGQQHVRPGGQRPYLGLALSVRNNADLEAIFKSKYEAKYVRGQPITTFHQLRACIGQFARFSVVFRVLRKKEVCESGALFKAVGRLALVKLFLSNFQLRASSSTVLCKAMHLKTLSIHAESYFIGKGEERPAANAAVVTEYLRTVCSAEKTETRRGAASMQREEVRVQHGRFLSGEDFLKFAEVAKKALTGVMLHVQSEARARARTDTGRTLSTTDGSVEVLRRQKALVAKWCIHMVGLVVFAGCGQRPQVYAQMQIPEHFGAESRRWGPDYPPRFSTLFEKTTRRTGFSKVSFPPWTAPLFKFHVQIVRPAILLMNNVPERAGRIHWMREGERPVLLHSVTCEPLTTNQIRSTFLRFVLNIDPELTNVTPMIVRSSYASWQFKLYNQRETFVGLTEAQFLDKLAKIMNSSADMLQSVYIAYGCNDESYDAVVRELFRRMSASEDVLG